MANSASLLLPVSNLTNLLALPHLHLTFAGFAARMAPVPAVVLAVEYVALRLLFRDDLRGPARPVARTSTPHRRARPRVVVLARDAGRLRRRRRRRASTRSGCPGAAARRAGGLGVPAPAARPGRACCARPTRASRSSCWASGVVVAALATGPLGDRGRRPAARTAAPRSPTCSTIAVVATLLAALVTNLSATLLLLPLLVPLGATAILAALIGLNVGSGLTWTGSLANLLWRRGLDRLELPPSSREFHRVSLVITPLALLAGVATLRAGRLG